MKPHRLPLLVLAAGMAALGGCASSEGGGGAAAPVGSGSFGCIDSYDVNPYPAVSVGYYGYGFLYGYGYPEDLCSAFGKTVVYYPASAPPREVITVQARDRHTTTIHRDSGSGSGTGWSQGSSPAGWSSDSSSGSGSYTSPPPATPRMEPVVPSSPGGREPVAVPARPN